MSASVKFVGLAASIICGVGYNHYVESVAIQQVGAHAEAIAKSYVEDALLNDGDYATGCTATPEGLIAELPDSVKPDVERGVSCWHGLTATGGDHVIVQVTDASMPGVLGVFDSTTGINVYKDGQPVGDDVVEASN